MATTPKTIFRGAATVTTSTVLYTTPALTQAVVTNIIVTNTAATAATFTMALGGTSLHTTTAIAANTTIYIDLRQTLAAAQTVQGGASAITVNFHITGVEIS
jgi:hypothetical protein